MFVFKNITRTVWFIALISLFNDFSSEMLYPIVPLYLSQIGYGGLFVGILEGLAELIAGLTKIYTGSLSDQLQRRLPFVNMGYSLSVLSRPLMVLSQWAGLIFLGRSIDKVGKGLRTAARDALLADECKPENRAEVFGFHRAMDTLGAILGPSMALIYLHFNPEDYRSIFLLSLLPGCITILLTFMIREKKATSDPFRKYDYSISKNFSFYKFAPRSYLIFLGFVLGFALLNSSDMFLLLRAKQTGLHEVDVLKLYILFNLTFAVSAFPVGKIADRLNKTFVLCFGFLLYAATYLLMALFDSTAFIVASFILYGLYYACTQGIIKALLIEKVSADQKSNAVGFYEGFNSISLMIANALAGFIWYHYGGKEMLLYTGIGATLIAILLFTASRPNRLLAGKIPCVEK